MHRILGIDYGEKRVGLALSDPMHMIASPYKTIPNNPDIIVAIQSIMKAEIVECCFIIDLPDLGGSTRLESLGQKVFTLCEFEGE